MNDSWVFDRHCFQFLRWPLWLIVLHLHGKPNNGAKKGHAKQMGQYEHYVYSTLLFKDKLFICCCCCCFILFLFHHSFDHFYNAIVNLRQNNIIHNGILKLHNQLYTFNAIAARIHWYLSSCLSFEILVDVVSIEVTYCKRLNAFTAETAREWDICARDKTFRLRRLDSYSFGINMRI